MIIPHLDMSASYDIYDTTLRRIRNAHLSYPQLVRELRKISAEIPDSKTYLDIELGAWAEFGEPRNTAEHLERLFADFTVVKVAGRHRMHENYTGNCILIAHTMKKQGLLGMGDYFSQMMVIQNAALSLEFGGYNFRN